MGDRPASDGGSSNYPFILVSGECSWTRPATTSRPPRCWRRCCPSRDVFGRSTADGTLSADVASRLAVLERDDHGEPAPVDRAAVATVRRRADELIRRVERAAASDRASIETLPLGETDHDPGRLLASRIPIESLSGEAVEGTGCVRAAARSSRRTIRWRAPSG